ncbi:MAG: glycerate kinase [Acidimicrobiales bacterium]
MSPADRVLPSGPGTDRIGRPPVVVVAPDKFRGTADAIEVAGAMAGAVTSVGWKVVRLPLSDGGEGLLDACAGICPDVASTRVAGPDGAPVIAEWRHGTGIAVVEMARASGLTLAGGPAGNDPLGATSRGTGELLVAAARLVGPGGTVVVGLGGSACTDGGRGAMDAVEEAGGLGGTTLIGACDVDVGFLDAAPMFAPQKGAEPDQVAELSRRLEQLADGWVERFGIDVRDMPGAGAAGGTGGALVVLGGRLQSGYRLVADLVGLTEALSGADLVVTGEGALDASSFNGKVVGGVVGDARRLGLATLVVAGRSTVEGVAGATRAGCEVVSLTERFGPARAMGETLECIGEVTAQWLAGRDARAVWRSTGPRIP